MLHVRVGENCRKVIDGTARYRSCLQGIQPLGCCTRSDDTLYQGNQLMTMGKTRAIDGKAIVRRPLRPADSLTEPGELGFVADGYDDMTISCPEVPIRHDVRMGVSQPRRLLPTGEVVHCLIGQPRHLDIKERRVNLLAFARLVAISKRGHDTYGGIQTGQDVGQGDADLQWAVTRFPIRVTGYAHQSAHALDQEVVAGTMCVGACLT